MIINIKNKSVLALPSLYYMVMRSIYERKWMRPEEVRMMEESMVGWAQKIDLDKTMGRLNEREEILVGLLAKLLTQDRNGEFNNKKLLYKQHKIDWRKAEGIPGANTAEDLARAKKMYEEYAAKNPEQEFMGAQSSDAVKKALNFKEPKRKELTDGNPDQN